MRGSRRLAVAGTPKRKNDECLPFARYLDHLQGPGGNVSAPGIFCDPCPTGGLLLLICRSAPPSQPVMSVRSTIVLNVLTPTLVGPMLFVKYNTADR